MRLPPSSCFAVLAALAIALPPVLLGPWLPFVDLLGFVGLNAYPPGASYGPFHYYVFQFTYVGHYAVSRLLCDLGMPVPWQVVTFYLVQAGVYFLVLWRLLERFVPNPWIRSVALALGALAFWNRCFLWGGPLAFSLGATAMWAATYFVLREGEDANFRAGGRILALSLFAAACHPFAVPFAVLMLALRFALVGGKRLETGGLVALMLVAGWVIRRDAPDVEAGAAKGLWNLVSLRPATMATRLHELLGADLYAVKRLFAIQSPPLSLYLLLMAGVRLVGFAVSPVVAWRARKSPGVRGLALLNTVIGVLYFTSNQHEIVIPEWPQRILTFWSPFTFAAGIVGPLFLFRERWPARLGADARVSPVAWTLPALIVVVVTVVQVPVLQRSAGVERGFQQAKAALLGSPATNAVVVVAGVDDLTPFYLRGVPFLLFSDPEIIARGLLVSTEWHFQARHGTRLTETWFDLGRPRYLAVFSPEAGGLKVSVEPQPAGEFAPPRQTNVGGFGSRENLALAHLQDGTTLLFAGCYRDAIAHFKTSLRLVPNDPMTHHNYGVALARLGDVPAAIQRMETALQLKPDYVDAHFHLAGSLWRTGRQAEAAQRLEIVVRLKPDHAAAQTALAQMRGAR